MIKTAFPFWVSMVMIFIILNSCEDDSIVIGDIGSETTPTGVLSIDFKLPEYHLIPDGIRRVAVNIAPSADSLFLKNFLFSLNVSDHVETYELDLQPGRYYYEAVITCTAGGDTCMYGGFPGGRSGTQHALEIVIVTANKTTVSRPIFY